MKKLCFLLALATLVACRSEENLPPKQCVIRLTSEITPMSRGTDLNQQSTQIVSGQKVGVTITGAKSEHNNVAWTVGNSGELTNTSSPVYWGDGNATITAYHPYNAAWAQTNASRTFTVSIDQSGNGYLESDLLWSTKTASKSTTPVPLTFTHKLAKINVTLTSEEVSNLSNATISICGTNIEAVFNPLSGDVSSAEKPNVCTIKAGVNTSTASAIIIPQTVKAGAKFIQVELDGKYYYYVLPADKAFETGNSYSYTLKLKTITEIECISSGITNWNDEAINGNGEEAEYFNMVTVTLTEAGTLASVLGDQILTLTSLKVVGEIHGADIRCLRQMLGASEYAAETRGALTELDLSEAVIVKSSETYIPTSGTPATTVDNVLGPFMFKACSQLKKIELPNTITKIEVFAFENCSGITEITIPSSVQNYNLFGAFQGCDNLTNIYVDNTSDIYTSIDGVLYNKEKTSLMLFPLGRDNATFYEGIESIRSDAFHGCNKLTEIVIPNNVTEIGNAAFCECSNLNSVTLPDGLTTIPYEAFAYCRNLGNLGIPSSVTKIESFAFHGCGFTSITIPNTVTSIEKNGIFRGCDNLTSIVVDNSNSVYDSRENCNAIIEESTNTLIAGCKNTTIPNNVTSIGDWAFASLSGLTSITIPNGVTSIGAHAFDRTGLTSITIPNSVTSIGEYSFLDCLALTSITIPNSVTSIGDLAFWGCHDLANVYCYATTLPSIEGEPFIEISASATLHVPQGTKEQYAAAWGEYFSNIVEME